MANLDPGMNDPLPLGARGKPLSSPFTPFCDPRAPLPPSISADAATTPPGSVPLSLPFHFLFAGLATTHSYLRSSPFDHRHPPSPRPPSPLLPPPLEAAPFSFEFSPLILSPAFPLSKHSRSPRKLITGRVTLVASSPACSRSFATLSIFVLQRGRRRGR